MKKSRYSKEEFYEEIKRIYNIENRININLYKKYTTLNVDYVYYINKYGGIKNICSELGLEYLYYNQPAREDIIDRASKLYLEHGYINKELCCANKISSTTVRRMFGGYNNLFEAINIDLNMPRFVTLDEVLDDIKIFNEKYSSISSTKYRKLGKYSCTIINKYGGWRKLLDMLGIKPLFMNYGKEYMIEKVKEVYEEYGFITADLVNDNCDFSYQAFRHNFKSKKDVSTALGYKNVYNQGRSQNERLIGKILNELINEEEYITEMTWAWLRSSKSGYNMYCDFYIPKLNLVIEYNGEQHYRFIKKFHRTEKGFFDLVNRDIDKAKLLKLHNINLVIIKYDEKITLEFIDNILKKYNNA